MVYFFVIIYFLLVVLMCRQESKRRKIGFVPALLIMFFLTPFLGLVLISNRPLRNPVGCEWCGNTENEADYCGVCGKNIAGELRPGFVPK